MATTRSGRARLTGVGRGVFTDPGQRGMNILYVPANVADEETVTIGNDVFEFDRAADGVTAGRIAVTGHAGDTPAAATNALIAKINSANTQGLVAVDKGDNEILIYGTRPDSMALACTETLAGSGNVWAAATMFGYRSGNVPRAVSICKRTPTATEVTLGVLRAVFNFTVAHAIVQIKDADGLIVAFGGAVTCATNQVTITNGTNPDFAATHTVVIIAFEA